MNTHSKHRERVLGDLKTVDFALIVLGLDLEAIRVDCRLNVLVLETPERRKKKIKIFLKKIFWRRGMEERTRKTLPAAWRKQSARAANARALSG